MCIKSANNFLKCPNYIHLWNNKQKSFPPTDFTPIYALVHYLSIFVMPDPEHQAGIGNGWPACTAYMKAFFGRKSFHLDKSQLMPIIWLFPYSFIRAHTIFYKCTILTNTRSYINSRSNYFLLHKLPMTQEGFKIFWES